MAKTKTEVNKERLEFVRREYGKRTSGLHVSNDKKSKILRQLWKKAKKEIK